jgi:hypothetical protein
MADEELIANINQLMEEEHSLRHVSGGTDSERLGEIDVTLDQCWDLLRQRRARRDAGQVDTSDVRPGSTVEGYQQ